MSSRELLLIIWTVVSSAAHALELDPLFYDNMVLQRDCPVCISGTANAGDKVTVEFAPSTGSGQAGQVKTAVADFSNHWKLFLDPMSASSKPWKLTVSSSSNDPAIQCSNLLVGDVWLCSGQSNMDRPLKALIAPVPDGDPQIRIIALAHAVNAQPQQAATVDPAFSGSWQEAAGRPLQDISATAFYFAQRLRQAIDVPIGLVESAWGGTLIEPWCPPDALTAAGISEPAPGKKANETPTAIYNAMIYPLRNFTFKGVIWYQGESNANKKDPVEYGRIFPAMITGWRELFGNETMPFLFVQLAPFNVRRSKVPESWALLRESQAKALALPNTGMAVITDAGEFSDIHPQNKPLTGERLARLALRLDGVDIAALGPGFQRLEKKKDRLLIWFDHAESGLETRRVAMNRQREMPPGEDPDAFVVDADHLQGFELCDSDGKWAAAEAEIKDGCVEVHSAEIRDPVAVRYGWADFPLCNLYNKDGLPAVPFRATIP